MGARDTEIMTGAVQLDKRAIQHAAARHGVAELSILGFAVTGGFTADSDLDFLVEFLPQREDPFEDYCALKEELEHITQ